jgi:nitrogen fixation NifU-like protein
MAGLYSEEILEHSKYPSNYGTLDHPTVSHEEHNPLCGDEVRIDLLIEDGVVQDVRFSGHGCAISQASASMLTDAVKGMSVEDARAFNKDDLLEMIGIPLHRNPMRLKCALLSLKAFKMGLYGSSEPLDDEDL